MSSKVILDATAAKDGDDEVVDLMERVVDCLDHLGPRDRVRVTVTLLTDDEPHG